jgi:DNA-binding XRE family transcriptional regulator
MITATDLRCARKAIRETQEQFSQRFGVIRTTYTRWEKEGPPSAGTAYALIERVLAELAVASSEAAE